MSENRVILDSAAFMDSARAAAIRGCTPGEARTVVQRFLAACYEDLGKVPRLLEGDEMEVLLREVLPRHFGSGDGLADHVEEVVGAFLGFLEETEVVPAAFELHRALGAAADEFRRVVARGDAHAAGAPPVRPTRPIAHRGEKVGRNDPCPCGSGRKFKKCCMRLGGGGSG